MAVVFVEAEVCKVEEAVCWAEEAGEVYNPEVSCSTVS